ncbi:aspartyl/lysyl-trna synthetase [Holotrichia oblita]|uniref:Aspartyl/lysyl-trna synthetase n=1 Tax=Holotrichia oblita TaxID=644536 RepID=A0ACB9T7Z8_HOLOL|nr:aspartyl/lysyl-trna synthetase [Holotrichia oblita]
MKDNLFVDVNDGSCSKKLQVVIPQQNKNADITTGASLIATGKLNIGASGQIELQANKIDILGECIISQGYPFAPRKIYPPEYIRQYLHLRPRTNKFGSLLRIRDALNFEIHNFLHLNGFINIHTPILTSSDCEGAGEVFVVTPNNNELLKDMKRSDISLEEAYFNKKAYLSVSGQLHLEAAAHGLCKVYTFGPTFRAENSKSKHHLSEFYMLEVEMAFTENIEELISFIERLIRTISSEVLNKCSEDIANFEATTENNFMFYASKPYHILNYAEALDVLEKNIDKFKTAYCNKEGPSKEHEMFLVKHCGGPVFIINWPKEMKPFYMKECVNDPVRVSALDLLGPNVGEIVGGSLRENDYQKLKARIPAGNTDLDWYLDLRKFGNVPTAGFGLGFERLIQSLLSINNIRDTIPYPRWAHNCSM